ncbi:hypothetical protein MPER_06022, partial [Moniliophthora perniciosa FA553]
SKSIVAAANRPGQENTSHFELSRNLTPTNRCLNSDTTYQDSEGHVDAGIMSDGGEGNETCVTTVMDEKCGEDMAEVGTDENDEGFIDMGSPRNNQNSNMETAQPEYWLHKLTKIETKIEDMVPDAGTDARWVQLIYHTATSTPHGKAASNLIQQVREQLEIFQRYLTRCRRGILSHLGEGEVYDRCETLRARLRRLLLLVTDLGLHALDGGISLLLEEYRKGGLMFQSQRLK